METLIQPMNMDLYDEVMALWTESENVGLSRADERESIEAYLAHNPDMSFVAKADGRIIGAVLCGHDRRQLSAAIKSGLHSRYIGQPAECVGTGIVADLGSLAGTDNS